MSIMVVDIETTGLDPERHRIVEVAVVGLADRHCCAWSSLVRQDGGEVDCQALAVNGLTLESLQQAPDEASVIRRVAETLTGNYPPAFKQIRTGPGTILAAHHIPFDLAFLNAAFRRHGLPEWRGDFICTRSLAALTMPELPDRRLGTVAAALGITPGRGHRALEDAQVTAQILEGLLDRAGRQGIEPRNVLVERPDRPLSWVPPQARVLRLAG